jgi:hypothetical protein
MKPEDMNEDEMDPSVEELNALFGDVADAAYSEPVVEEESGEVEEVSEIEAPEMEDDSAWGDIIGPEIIAMVRAEIQAQLPIILSEAVRLSREELKRAFAPIKAHRDALQAKLESEKAAREEAMFIASAPRMSEPAIKAIVDENLVKFPSMDRMTSYKLALALAPAQELAATEAVMPGMGKAMAATSSPNTPFASSLNSHFNRNKR